MAETTRVCSLCHIERPIERFSKEKNARGGRRADCLECRYAKRKARTTPEDRAKWAAYGRAWRASKHGKRVTAAYRQSEHGKDVRRAYAKTPKAQEYARHKREKYAERNPEKMAAREAVKRARKLKRIPRASALACAQCGKKAHSYHHHKGYQPEHHLEVIPLCKPCHDKAG